MQDESERRLARNEGLFRETNEAIERGQWRDDPAKPVRFRCECSRLQCNEPVAVTLGDYEQVRGFPRRFLLVEGHEMPEIETVVSRAEGYVVVEKHHAAGETAAATDPRH
jgi:hypothetical protein